MFLAEDVATLAGTFALVPQVVDAVGVPRSGGYWRDRTELAPISYPCLPAVSAALVASICGVHAPRPGACLAESRLDAIG